MDSLSGLLASVIALTPAAANPAFTFDGTWHIDAIAGYGEVSIDDDTLRRLIGQPVRITGHSVTIGTDTCNVDSAHLSDRATAPLLLREYRASPENAGVPARTLVLSVPPCGDVFRAGGYRDLSGRRLLSRQPAPHRALKKRGQQHDLRAPVRTSLRCRPLHPFITRASPCAFLCVSTRNAAGRRRTVRGRPRAVCRRVGAVRLSPARCRNEPVRTALSTARSAHPRYAGPDVSIPVARRDRTRPRRGNLRFLLARGARMNPPIDSLQVGIDRSHARPDGLERVLHTLVEALPGQGVNVRSPGHASRLVPASGHMDTTPLVLPGHGQRAGLASAPQPTVPPHKPDLVALHAAQRAVPMLGQFTRVPRVVHFHGSWADEVRNQHGVALLGALRYGLERFVYHGGTRLIVQSLEAGDVLNLRYRVPADRIRIVPACIDPSRYAVRANGRTARKRLQVPHDRPAVLCVRPLLAGVGLEELIDAIFIVRQTVRDVYVMIVGTGPNEAALRARIAARGLERHVFLRGFVADDVLPLYYRAADLTVVPTVAMKDCGLTAIESLATGTPVLVTASGGLAETVAPLCEELVLSSGGYQALASGITEALRGDRFTPAGRACRRYARKHFDHALVAAQTADVYRDAIGAL